MIICFVRFISKINSLKSHCATGTIYKKDTSLRAITSHPHPSLDDVITDVRFGVGDEVVFLVIGTLKNCSGFN